MNSGTRKVDSISERVSAALARWFRRRQIRNWPTVTHINHHPV